MFDLRKGATCPQCEKGHLIETKKDLEFKYKEEVLAFPEEVILSCDQCDYEGLTKEANERIEAKLTDFRRTVEKLLTSDEMKAIRQKLRFNKKEMAELLSVNEKTIGRYESGKITQSDQVDMLYRIFGKYPTIVWRLRPDKCDFGYRSLVRTGQRHRTSYSISTRQIYKQYSNEKQHKTEEWEGEYAEAA